METKQILRRSLTQELFDLRRESMRAIEHLSLDNGPQAVGVTLDRISKSLVLATEAYKEWVEILEEEQK